MNKLKFRVFIVLPLITLILWGVWMLVPSEKDAREYHELVSKSQANRKSKKSPYTATQYREGVVKDIYYRSDSEVLQARIASDRSRLVFDQQPEGMSILEYMENLTCVIQKELFYLSADGQEVIADSQGGFKDRKGRPIDQELAILKPMQLVRYIIADEAVYRYNKEQLDADRPTIIEYRLEGHQLPQNFDESNVMMQGVAENVEVSFENDELAFHAKRLKARIFPKGGNP